MTATWQTLLSLLVVATVAGIFLRSALKKRKNGTGGCGAGCCPPNNFKKRLDVARHPES